MLTDLASPQAGRQAGMEARRGRCHYVSLQVLSLCRFLEPCIVLPALIVWLGGGV